MSKTLLLALVLGMTITGCASTGSNSSAIRLDARSAAAAEASYRQMHRRLPQQKQMQLQFAVLAINMIGIESAHELVAHPDRDNMGVARIKDRIAGMTADEILAYAADNSAIKAEITSP